MSLASADLLRLSTAGSVDDGKSTLIGRLLHDSKSVFIDQLEDVEDTSKRMGSGYVNLALLTDGLRAEREQGITIDVAYRYFATQRRRFIIADTPGHEQYTRNMITGASTSDLSVILVDARQGIVEQSRRHAFIASLLKIPHLVVAVNKMDLVGWDRRTYKKIVTEFTWFAKRLDIPEVAFIPVCALAGDNVVEPSPNMPWYVGPPLLHHLEHVVISSDRNLTDPRFPVQWVIRPLTAEHHDYRAYAGQVASGTFRPGDEVVVLPSGVTAHISSIDTLDGPLPEAHPFKSVAIRLDADVDVSRGDMICRVDSRPEVTRSIQAAVCWMHSRPMATGDRYLIKHTTRTTPAVVDAIIHRVDVNTLRRDEGASGLELNQIGRVSFRTSTPLMWDAYERNRITGSFIIIDESTNFTLGAGMIIDPSDDEQRAYG